MTKQPRRAIIEYKIAKPFVDAMALALGSSAFALFFQAAPLEWALVGGGFSLCWYWGTNNLKRGKKPSPRRSVIVNSRESSRKVNLLEYSTPSYIARETWKEMAERLVTGKAAPQPGIANQADKPSILTEFVFVAPNGVELLEIDVRHFLRAAWRNRDRGRGLSQRRWVRDVKLRPQWYKILGVSWYYAFIELLADAEIITVRQLVIVLGYQQVALKYEPRTTLAILKWAEGQKKFRD